MNWCIFTGSAHLYIAKRLRTRPIYLVTVPRTRFLVTQISPRTTTDIALVLLRLWRDHSRIPTRLTLPSLARCTYLQLRTLASLRLARRVAIHALSTRSTNIERAALLYHKRRTHSEPIPIRSTVATVPEFRVAADKNRSRLNCGRNLNETVNRMFRRSPGIRETRDRRSERGQTRIRKRCSRQMLHSRAACSPRTFLRFAVFARSVLRVARIFFLPSARYVLSTGERTAQVSRSAGVFDFQFEIWVVKNYSLEMLFQPMPSV